jgi:hypothetical protein
MATARQLPDARALAVLVSETHVATLLVHLHELRPDEAARWTSGPLPGLVARAADADHLVLDVVEP